MGGGGEASTDFGSKCHKGRKLEVRGKDCVSKTATSFLSLPRNFHIHIPFTARGRYLLLEIKSYSRPLSVSVASLLLNKAAMAKSPRNPTQVLGLSITATPA